MWRVRLGLDFNRCGVNLFDMVLKSMFSNGGDVVYEEFGWVLYFWFFNISRRKNGMGRMMSFYMLSFIMYRLDVEECIG